MTNDFVGVLEQAIATDPDRVAQEIAYAADGRSINNSALIWALVSAKAEQNYMIRGFSTEFINLKINRSDSFSSAMEKASNLNLGAPMLV